MTTEHILDLVGAVFVAAGAFFSLAGALGLVRFPDVMSRLHAATKPSVFGLLLVLTGVALDLRRPEVWGALALTFLLQVMTAPVSAHLVSREAHRTDQWDSAHAVIDQLRDDEVDEPTPESAPADRKDER